VKIRYDPLDVKATEEMIKKKEMDIADLKKQLQMPTTQDPLTKEIEEIES